MNKKIILLLLLAASSCKLSSDPLEKEMNLIFRSFDTRKGPGCAVAVIQNGHVLFKKGYGLANLEYRIPVTPRSVFDICSLTKQFTGLAISTLIEEKKLSPDDDIHAYLPDVPDFGKPIRISHLLHHTSGLRDWPEALHFGGWKWEDVFSYQDIMNFVHHQKELDFEPGSEYSYSNTGYNLLAAIVEKRTGKTFEAWMDENIFGPLGMSATHFMSDYRSVTDHLASCYEYSDREWKRVPSELSAMGSSSLFTSIDDLIKWAVNLEDNLNKKNPVYLRMIQEGTLLNGDKVHYGYGLAIEDYKGLRLISHTGGWAGYRSGTTYFPDQQLAVLTLSNDADFDPSINFRVADYFLHSDFKEKENQGENEGKSISAIRVPDSLASRYVGRYKLRPGWILNITREKDQLMTQATHEDKYLMYASSDTSYWIPAYGASMNFKRGKNGVVNLLEYKHIQARRIDPFLPKPEELKAYEGTFYSPELASEYQLEGQQGQLILHQRRTGDFALIPEEKDGFSSDLGDLQFFRDSTGALAGFRLSGGRVKNLLFGKRP
jgi:CubicO group peptidase (beta-lactamase class C family)